MPFNGHLRTKLPRRRKAKDNEPRARRRRDESLPAWPIGIVRTDPWRFLIVRFSAKLSRLDCDWNAASRSILNDGTSGPSAERVGGSANDLFLRPSRFSVTATTAIEQRFVLRAVNLSRRCYPFTHCRSSNSLHLRYREIGSPPTPFGLAL